MKKKKALYKKFYRKYIFLQNSLVYFLDWRISKFSNSIAFRNNEKYSFINKKKKTFLFLEQEKISFQEYWKNSEQKKLEKAIQNMNKEFIPSKNFFDFKNFFHILRKKNIFSIFKNSKNKRKKSFFVVDKKISTFFLSQKLATQFQQKKSFQLFNKKPLTSNIKFFFIPSSRIDLKKQKKINKFKKLQFLSSNYLETFIPKSDFRKKKIFFGDKKLSELFPKKQNFIQYWSFPLLGFVVFFSSTPSFFDIKLKTVFQSFVPFSQLNAQKQKITSDKLSEPILFKFCPSFFSFSSKNKKQNDLLEIKSKESNLNSIFEFSYTNEFSKEKYKQFQYLENDEFEKYCNFSFKIFQNSLNFLVFDLLNNNNKQSLVDFYDQISLKKNIHKKIIETKRNTFHWKCFKLNEQFIHFPIFLKQKFFFLYLFEIPRKAQFFNPIFENNSLVDFSKFQRKTFFYPSMNLNPQQKFKKFSQSSSSKINFSETPLLNFSKTMFFFNEFEKNLNNIFHLNLSIKNNQQTKIMNYSFLKNFTPFKEILFYSKKGQYFLNSRFFNQCNHLFFEFSANSLIFENDILQNNKKILLNSNRKNFFYLTKWLKTQNFWKLNKNFSTLKLSSNLKNIEKMKMEKNLQNIFKIYKKFINIENILSLDFIYFRKLFSTMSISKENRKSKVSALNSLSNFSQSLKNKNSLINIKSSFSNKIVYNSNNNKNYYLFFLKKRTFQFLIMEHYKKNFKNFINNFFYYPPNHHEKKIINSSYFLQQQNIKNLSFFKKTRFQNNIFMKSENTNDKIIFNNFRNFSKITCLKIPIFLDFQNKIDLSNIDSVQNKKYSFDNSMNFLYSNSIGKDENFEARLNSLSSNIVPFLNKKRIYLRNQNIFDLNNFFKSKTNFFQTIYEKTVMNIKKNEFLSFSIFQLKSLRLKNHFLFEKIKKKKPFTFNNHKNFYSLVLLPSFLKTNKFLLKSTKFCVLKERNPFFKFKSLKKTFSFQQQVSKNKTFTAKKQFFKYYFSNFQSKKFERIFRTFLTPLNKENSLHVLFNNKTNMMNFQKQNLKELFLKEKKEVYFTKLQKNRNTFLKVKTPKDNIILQTLSTTLQKNFLLFGPTSDNKNSNLPFFITFPKKYIHQKSIQTTCKNFNSDIKKNQNEKLSNSFYFNFISEQFIKNTQIKTKENFPNQPSKLLTYRTKNILSPCFILKHDGFVFFSRKPVERLQKQTKNKQEFFFDLRSQKIRETNSFTLKRLEQEKYLQKKRRMKKQKLETRRRKKRKRFYPRPIWLRFHLYKKFLKTRHSNLVSNSSGLFQNKKNKIISQNLLFRPKNIFVFIPKISKNKLKFFSNNKMNCFYFDFSIKKKCKNILASSFFTNKKTKKENIFINQNDDKKMKTFFKCFKTNFVFNISKKKNNIFYSIFLKNHNEFNENKIYRKNKQNWGFSSNRNFLFSSEKHFYKKFESNIKYSKQTNILYKLNPISQNLEHYKISGEILSEFLRLSWKSYWFLTNFQPYTKRIMQNLRKMQKLESEINYSSLLSSLFQNKFFLFQSVPIFQNNFSNDTQDLLLRNSMFRKLFWYCNIKNSLEEKVVIGNSLNQLNQKSLNFQNIQNYPEYNRILYTRVSEILRNFKSLENIEDPFIYIRNKKNLKIPKRKNEIIFSNSSFFTKSALFFENFHIPSQPSIPAFSLFSSIFHDFSIKPTGEIPTLRSLWALHQTNFYHFQEKNMIRSLWTLKKRTDNLKSFKGTKKIVHFFRKNTSLEKLNSLEFFTKKISKFYVLNSLQKDKLFEHKTKNFLENFQFSFLIKKSNFLIFENLTNKKKFFISNAKTGYNNFLQQLDILSLQKFFNSEKKCSYFGIHTIQQNSTIFLRYLKFHLFSNTSKQNFIKSFGTPYNILKNSISFNLQNYEPLKNSYFFKNQNLNQQNSSKSSVNFWWSQKNNQSFDFLMNSQKTRFNSLQFIPFFSISPHFNLTENFSYEQNSGQNSFASFGTSKKKWPNFFSQKFVLTKSLLETDFKEKNYYRWKNENFYRQTQILWFGAILFHLAIFFTLLKLPEIRSTLKFKCVLFSKFFAGFFLIIFSIFHLFKKYTKKGSFVAKKIFSNTSFLAGALGNNKKVKKNEFLNMFSFDLKETLEFNNLLFSQNQNLQKKNLVNLLFYFPNSQKISFFDLKNLNCKKFILQNSQRSPKNLFFEFFLRFSKFSSFLSKNKNLTKYKKYKNLNLFFISIHNFYNFKNLLFLKKTKNCKIFRIQKLPIFFFKNSKSIFHFKNNSKQFKKKNILLRKVNKTKNFIDSEYLIDHNFLLSFNGFRQINLNFSLLDSKGIYSDLYRDKLLKQKFILNKSYFLLTKNNFTPLNKEKLNIAWQKVFVDYNSIGIQNSIKKQQNLKNFQTLYNNEKLLCQLTLSFLLFGKSTSIFTSSIVKFSTNVSSKILDFFEKIIFSIYKFLEKPAEVFIEWIALIFLIEWSSDIITFVPDTLDIFLIKSFQKFNRPIRSTSFFLNFINSQNKNRLFFSPLETNIPANFGNFFGFWSYINFTSFVFQKRLLYFFENFCFVISQPDMDLLTRQRKGIIFWDIWAEILLKAAEKYNVNIPSFITLKEEQELFIEKLLQDKEFLKNLQNSTQQNQTLSNLKNKSSFLKENKITNKTLNGEILEQNSLKFFIENFIQKERFQHFYEFSCCNERKNFKQKIDQLAIIEFLLPQIFEKKSFENQQNFNINIFNLIINKKVTKSEILNKGNNQNSSNKKKNVSSLFEILFSQFFVENSNKPHQKFFMLFSQPLFLDSFSVEYTTKLDRFSIYAGNPSGTYQGPETDLFIDIHPPKSLKHIQFSKYYEPAQYTLGSLICQIYSGLFSKQISKNILVIGSLKTAKTLFIQALAGETEMKMITDNAYRYSMVLRGVAVGMKYLRDVFDALVLQTPCFFLMEHIHVLGTKRPFLISDDENMKGIFSNFGLEQQEVHETNQMIYQLNRHSLVDYKRPYKGDFSMGIPTNFFVQNFYSNSENHSNSIFLSSGLIKTSQNSLYSGENTRNPISPLPIDSIEHSLLKQNFSEKEKTDNAFISAYGKRGQSFKKRNFYFQSRLQLSQEQIFAPPATSPFTILMIKEQKKLKPKKIVQENSWGGLSTDQFISYQKENFSIRAKVALLADFTMNLSRGKLDMITDLLVIIDSVRSNRGFVVFATTHLPSLLDPALRRPGRFDETISLTQSPNFLNRFEILKTSFQYSLTTIDFVDASIFTENLSEINILNLITATKLSFFHQYKYTQKVNNRKSKFSILSTKLQKNSKSFCLNKKKMHLDKLKLKLVSQIYPTKAFHNFLKSTFFSDFYSKKFRICQKKFKKKKNSQYSKYFLRYFKLFNYTILPKGPSYILNFAYSKIGIFLTKSNLLQDPTAFTPLSLNTSSSFVHGEKKNIQFAASVLYDSQKQQNLQLIIFLSGKIAEFCLQKNTLNFLENHQFLNQRFSFYKIDILNKTSFLFDYKFSIFPSFDCKNEKIAVHYDHKEQQKNIKTKLTKIKQSQFFFLHSSSSFLKITKRQPFHISMNYATDKQQRKTDFYWTSFGNDQSWRFITPFLFSIIQKRFLFTKNLLLSKMLFFDNKNIRKQPPNPPTSSILMPSKKFENFKRSENDFVQKSCFSINEKIQMHQQQRFLKQLYNIPIQQYYRSEILEKRTTVFSSSFQELAYLDSLTLKFSSSHFYQRKYLKIRHRFLNTNQWWNGLLPEHNSETTLLSDVDWRTMFSKTSKKKSSYLSKYSVNTLDLKMKKQSLLFENDKNQTFEFFMDFPDAEQYYNPKNRRWYFNNNFHFEFSPTNKNIFFENNKKSEFISHNEKKVVYEKTAFVKNSSLNIFDFSKTSSYWLTFDKTLQYEIYYHYLMLSFHNIFNYFNINREMLDLFVFQLLKKGFLKELDYLITISRF